LIWELTTGETGDLPTGTAPENVNQLRDPGIFEDADGTLYLLYAGRGEDALGIASLSSPNVVLVGDMDGDGAINFLDIGPFIVALSDPAAYQSSFNLDANVSGDTNGDGGIDFLDISGFIILLSR